MLRKHPNHKIYNGQIEFYDDKQRYHHDSGPAIIYDNGNLEYWVHGKRHRLDGPAIYIYKNSVNFYYAYYRNDLLDREDGPALIHLWNGYLQEKSFKQGVLHCETGPAVYYKDADPKIFPIEEYFLNGEQISKEAFINMLSHDQIKNYCLLS